MRVSIFLAISIIGILQSAIVDAAKGKSAVAVPRKSKGNPMSRTVFGSMFSRAFREMKVTFCSELEALTLQLTRPTDTQVSLKNLDELVRCLNAEYDNPQFTVSLLAKFSRKLCEPNVFTKLKSIVCLHKMMQECDSNAQNALTQSVRSLKSEKDEKVGAFFFSSESIEQAAGSASNVAELEAVELAREYAAYVLNFVDFRGEKVVKSSTKNKNLKKEVDNEERAEALLELFELSELVQKCCRQSQKGQVVAQCLTCLMDDRPWLTKQMQKVYEGGLQDEELEAELEQALETWDSKFKPKARIAAVKEVVKSLADREESVVDRPAPVKKNTVVRKVEEEDDETDDDDDDDEEEEKQHHTSSEKKKPSVSFAAPITPKAVAVPVTAQPAKADPVITAKPAVPAPVAASAPVATAVKATVTKAAPSAARSTAESHTSSKSSTNTIPKESKEPSAEHSVKAPLKKKIMKEFTTIKSSKEPVPEVKPKKKSTSSSSSGSSSSSSSKSSSKLSKDSKNVKSSKASVSKLSKKK